MTDYFAHQSSCVDEGVSIGAGTRIWHFCHVMSRTTIGERCNIGQNVFVASEVRIGNNVKIQNNVSLYTGVIVEDDVFPWSSRTSSIRAAMSTAKRNTKRPWCSEAPQLARMPRSSAALHLDVIVSLGPGRLSRGMFRTMPWSMATRRGSRAGCVNAGSSLISWKCQVNKRLPVLHVENDMKKPGPRLPASERLHDSPG
jgi:hypothetical protein